MVLVELLVQPEQVVHQELAVLLELVELQEPQEQAVPLVLPELQAQPVLLELVELQELVEHQEPQV